MTQYTYQTSFTLRLSGLNCGDHHVPLEIVYALHGEGDEIGLNMTKVTMTGKDGTRYRAHDWLLEILVTDAELREELLFEARAADEAASQHKAAIGSALRA